MEIEKIDQEINLLEEAITLLEKSYSNKNEKDILKKINDLETMIEIFLSNLDKEM